MLEQGLCLLPHCGDFGPSCQHLFSLQCPCPYELVLSLPVGEAAPGAGCSGAALCSDLIKSGELSARLGHAAGAVFQASSPAGPVLTATELGPGRQCCLPYPHSGVGAKETCHPLS